MFNLPEIYAQRNVRADRMGWTLMAATMVLMALSVGMVTESGGRCAGMALAAFESSIFYWRMMEVRIRRPIVRDI